VRTRARLNCDIAWTTSCYIMCLHEHCSFWTKHLFHHVFFSCHLVILREGDDSHDSLECVRIWRSSTCVSAFGSFEPVSYLCQCLCLCPKPTLSILTAVSAPVSPTQRASLTRTASASLTRTASATRPAQAHDIHRQVAP
jgi:hypothetical protein